MRCPYCGASDTKVIDSRPSDDDLKIRRRRECIVCAKRFTTYEAVETTPLILVKKNGEWAIIHRCRICGHFSSNRIAADDNPMKLMSIAMKPVATPPFPLERIEEMTRLMGGEGELKW